MIYIVTIFMIQVHPAVAVSGYPFKGDIGRSSIKKMKVCLLSKGREGRWSEPNLNSLLLYPGGGWGGFLMILSFASVANYVFRRPFLLLCQMTVFEFLSPR